MESCMQILVLNSGSSSIKFSIFRADTAAPEPHVEFSPEAHVELLLDGELSGVGSAHATLRTANASAAPVDASTLQHAIDVVFGALTAEAPCTIDAVGYRVVHPGPKLRDHQRITPDVLREIEAACAFAPLHDPQALQVIHAAMQRFPDAGHFACFDTVFHETMPEEASTYAIPDELRQQGVRRYGFHGLSCESVVRQMRQHIALPRRMAIAHLGSGCSVTALLDGRSVDTTMGLTPTGGVVMGTRPGDLDPGVVLYLLRQQQGTAAEATAAVEQLLNHNAGMVALTQMDNDVKAIRAAAASGDPKATLALKVFTRSVTKALGSYWFLLGGLDAIVFAGGIGEHDAQTRADVLETMGIALAPTPATLGRNIQQLTTDHAPTALYIVPADEDEMIAVHVAHMTTPNRKLKTEKLETRN
jgi:acetate kinase